MSVPNQEAMDRGNEVMKTHLTECQAMEIRQTRKGWLMECLGCEAKSEFKYFVDNNQMAYSLEESSCFCRMCFQPCYEWTMEVKDLNTNSEILKVNRPGQCCIGSCKCCCYQTATITSGGQKLGMIKENCYYCVPSFNTYDDTNQHTYTIHPPTCCGGICVNCCAEGNPCCGRGCCKVPYWIFPASQRETNGNVERVGKILKKPKSIATELLTDANAFEVEFPTDATTSQKAVLIGSTLYFNSVFFENQQENSSICFSLI